MITITKHVEDLAKTLKGQFKLSEFEALSLALEAERNDLLRRAFVLSKNDDHPSGLEAIAIALGFKK